MNIEVYKEATDRGVLITLRMSNEKGYTFVHSQNTMKACMEIYDEHQVKPFTTEIYSPCGVVNNLFVAQMVTNALQLLRDAVTEYCVIPIDRGVLLPAYSAFSNLLYSEFAENFEILRDYESTC